MKFGEFKTVDLGMKEQYHFRVHWFQVMFMLFTILLLTQQYKPKVIYQVEVYNIMVMMQLV